MLQLLIEGLQQMLCSLPLLDHFLPPLHKLCFELRLIGNMKVEYLCQLQLPLLFHHCPFELNAWFFLSVAQTAPHLGSQVHPLKDVEEKEMLSHRLNYL